MVMQGSAFPVEASAPLDIFALPAAGLLKKANRYAVDAEENFILPVLSVAEEPLFRKNAKDAAWVLW